VIAQQTLELGVLILTTLAQKVASAALARLSPWVHSRSLRSPARLARLALRPRAVGRLRAVHYGDNLENLDSS
jgi:hypothetical protein